MEWMKNMGLKKSFFLLATLSMVVALALIGMVFLICGIITADYPTGGIVIMSDGIVKELAEPTSGQKLVMDVTGWIEILSCILIPVGCVGIASLLFYRCKLKSPILVLQMGTERIRKQDLDFSIPEVSGDELGQVCVAFETMRAQLLHTNQELWRQAEERKRLNAAFSHDLRNPVTVLKGTVKLLRQGKADEHALDRMETYVLRLERYVEVMSSIQRLEQMPIQKQEVQICILRDEVEETVRLLAPNAETEVCVVNKVSALRNGGSQLCEAVRGEVHSRYNDRYNDRYSDKYGEQTEQIIRTDEMDLTLDHGLFLTVAENLIRNAARYTQRRIDISLSICTDEKYQRFFMMIVKDDGCGYPAKLIKDGPKPFGGTQEDAEHFGMGLYTSQMLCIKHGGMLILENDTSGGARATAFFSIS